MGIKDLIAGIGAKRNIAKENVLEAIFFAFKVSDLDISRLKAIAIPDFKAEERGIIKAAESLGVPVIEIPMEKIKKAEEFAFSELAYKKIGAKAVCEPCAVLGEKNAILVQRKVKKKGVTVAIAKCKKARFL
jgi:cobalt-precorrin 5A hydrolase